ncbi:MGDG synthase family glycosyltransferase [Brevibacillus sp. B_LB10_24]|uniref:MGDG synthase family glycosyltransferase n=1 Tax=Brevibacillus sp. B_LB10_24 TaxID=3380645 RepID=UPI0038BAF8B9
MKPYILICTEEWAGSGHQMAALSLQQAFQDKAPEANVRVVGGLATASPLLRSLSRITYYNSLRNTPSLWQRIYDNSNALALLLQKPLAVSLSKRLYDKLIRTGPDVVIATHAYCLPALAEAKRKLAKPFRLGCVVTDFHVNRFWVHPAVDFYLVAHEQVAEQLSGLFHVAPEKIYSFGIPIRPAFMTARLRPNQEWRNQLGLHPERFTVLLTGGEGKCSNFEPVLARLLHFQTPLQIIAITGKNTGLLARLQKTVEKSRSAFGHTVRILGFEEAIWEWMGAADVIITKPGGLTCSEALAMGKPLLLYQPLPGQEKKNSAFLRACGVAEEAQSLEQIASILGEWQAERERWQSVAQRTAKLGRADSAYQAAEEILTKIM